MEMGWITVVIAALAMVSVLAGCGSSPSTGSSPSRLSDDEFRFLAGYGRTADDEPVRDRAEQLLDQRCMQALGFKYIPSDPTAEDGPGTAFEREPYIPGIASARTEALAVQRRKATGYHLFDGYRPKDSRDVPAQDLYVRSLASSERERYTRALFGRPSERKSMQLPNGVTGSYTTGGCLGKAQRELYGSVEAAHNVLSLPQALLDQVGDAAARAPELEPKRKAWSACVKRATHRSFALPHDIVEQLRQEYARAGATTRMYRREIRYAVADTRCSFRTGLSAVYARVFRREADRVAAPVRRLLLQTLEVERKATARARTILAGTAP